MSLPPASKLTPKQMKLLEWVEAFLREKGYMPSRREIAAGLGVSSVATIQQHVAALESKGFLRLREGEFRGLELSKQWEKTKSKLQDLAQSHSALTARSTLKASSAPSPRSAAGTQSHSEIESEFSVPLLGRVAAGYPIEVFSTDERISIPARMRGSGKREIFALRVQGDSMIGEGILNGDLVVCEKAETARTGETVVALLNGEATLKTFQKSREGIALLPANPQYPILRVKDGDSFQVQGVLTGVLRTYGAGRP